MIDPLGDIALAADAVSAGAVRLVQKEVAVTQRGLRILVDCDDDGLDVLVAPTFTRGQMPNFGKRHDPRRLSVRLHARRCPSCSTGQR